MYLYFNQGMYHSYGDDKIEHKLVKCVSYEKKFSYKRVDFILDDDKVVEIERDRNFRFIAFHADGRYKSEYKRFSLFSAQKLYRSPQGYEPNKKNLKLEKGVVVFTNPDDELAQAKKDILEIIKNETSRRIRTIDGEELSHQKWMEKSQNYQDKKATYQAQMISGQDLGITAEDHNHALSRLNRKNNYVNHYRKVLKRKVLNLSAQEIKHFDPTDDGLWAELD